MNYSFLKNLDHSILIVTLILISLGLLIIFSVSYGYDDLDLGNFKKQAVFAIMGIAAMLLMSFFDYRFFKNYTAILYFVGFFLLTAVLLVGNTVRGMSGWIDLGFFHFQPSELMKIILVIVLAKYFSFFSDKLFEFKKIVISGICVGAPVILVLLQPDMGSAMVMIFIWLGMLAAAGVKIRHLLAVFLIGALIFAGSWSFLLEDYQKERLTTFLNPQADPLGGGYNVIQAVIAVGSGGFWGKGLGHGSQSQLNFLPEKHTDFAFAVLAEEMGFVGVIFLLILFAILLFKLINISLKVQDNFGKMLASGAAVLLFSHIVINIGMNMGVMPVTGIPLPFISYGGSFLLSILIMLGIVQSVAAKGVRYKLKKEE